MVAVQSKSYVPFNPHKDGTYVLRASASNANGLLDTSDVRIIVKQTATTLRVAPHSQLIPRSSKKPYTAAVTDQFDHAMRTQPVIMWSMLQDKSSIDAGTGLFAAGPSRGHCVIEATDKLDSLTGTSGVTVE